MPCLRIRHLIVLLPLLVSAAVASAQDGGKDIEGWGKFIDPLQDGNSKLENGTLALTAPGPVHDLSIELGKMNAPRVLQELAGDFTIVVRVDGEFAPGGQTIKVRTPYHGAGILVGSDEKNYVRLERATLSRGGQYRHYTNYEVRLAGRLQRFGQVVDAPLKPGVSTWLKLERRGNGFRGFVKQEGTDWKELPGINVAYPDKLQVGVATVNASTKSLTALFSELSLK